MSDVFSSRFTLFCKFFLRKNWEFFAAKNIHLLFRNKKFERKHWLPFEEVDGKINK
jgi:hypothetical protein